MEEREDQPLEPETPQTASQRKEWRPEKKQLWRLEIEERLDRLEEKFRKEIEGWSI